MSSDHKLSNSVEKSVRDAMKMTFSPRELLNVSKIDCINVFSNRWRVNCWSVGPNFKIPHSFFLIFDAERGIISSNPAIAPQAKLVFDEF